VKFKPGDRVTTFEWSKSSDGKEFVVVELLDDGEWLLCRNASDQLRQFAREHVRGISTNGGRLHEVTG